MSFKLERYEERPATIGEHRALRDEIKNLLAALREIKDLADDAADITENGGPNLAMRIQTIASVYLD